MTRRAPARRLTALLSGVLLALSTGTGVAAADTGGHPSARVLTVGTWHGRQGDFASIQAAIDAASPGDWILVAPGDYKERADYPSAGHPQGHQPAGEQGGGLWIDKPDIHIRGLDRNTVIVDGTKPGSPACSSREADQDYGPGSQGRNGIEVWRASGVTIENLTSCNFLGVSDGTGNEIWWNGGYDTGHVYMDGYYGAYLSATSTFFKDNSSPQATYGIFVSAAKGPGLIDHTYASNMNDSGYYIGACPDCNAVLDHAHGQNNVLGYSGTNSGGHLVITRSEFDQNGEGIDTNSASNGDLPAPQNGACPGGDGSCWIVTGNYIHDNNNRNVPGNGLGLVGAGIVVAGGRNDTIAGNTFVRNGAWAVALLPYFSGVPSDSSGNPETSVCTDAGGSWDNQFADLLAGGPTCFFTPYGSRVAGNVFRNNGGFGQPTNGDLADLSDFTSIGVPAATPNCWTGNHDAKGVSSSPAGLQVSSCDAAGPGAGPSDPLFGQVLCNLKQLPPNDPFGFCAGAVYPQQTGVKLIPLPRQQSMPDPFAGLPHRRG